MGNQRPLSSYTYDDSDSEPDGEALPYMPRPMASLMPLDPFGGIEQTAGLHFARLAELAFSNILMPTLTSTSDWPYRFLQCDASPQRHGDLLALRETSFLPLTPRSMLTMHQDILAGARLRLGELMDDPRSRPGSIVEFYDYFGALGDALSERFCACVVPPLCLAAQYSNSHPWPPPPAPFGAVLDSDSDDQSVSSAATQDSMPGLCCDACGVSLARV